MKQGHFHPERLAAPNQERAVYNIEDRFRADLKKFFKQQEKDVSAFLRSRNFNPDEVKNYDWRADDKKLFDIYNKYVLEAYIQGQQFAFENVAKVIKKLNRRKKRRFGRKYNIWVDFETPVPQAEELVTSRPIQFTTRYAPIPDWTTQRFIALELSDGYREFESTAQLAGRVAGVYDDCQMWRAELIARTETMRSFNDAGLDYYKATGVVDRVELIIANDACEECQGIYSSQSIYPLDESGGVLPIHPNCRCTWGPVVRDETIGNDLIQETEVFDPSVSGTGYLERQKRIDESMETLTKAYNDAHGSNISSNELKLKMTAAVKEEVKDARVCINIDSDLMDDFLREGRFKSQFETGTSKGSFAPEARAEFEKNFFGYANDLNPEKRPIYGFLADKTDNATDVVEQYGNVTCVLKKDEVINRTTFTWDDSLNATRMQPVKLSNPDYRAACFTGSDDIYNFEKGLMNLKNINQGEAYIAGRVPYVEAQIHGGVSIKDVDSMIIHTQIKKTDDINTIKEKAWVIMDSIEGEGNLRRLTNRGIKYEFVDADGEAIAKDLVKLAREYAGGL